MRIRAGFVIAAALFVSSSAWARGGGGCVEEGTSVLTPGGPVPVEGLVPGDAVLTLEGARLSSATVSACFAVQPNEYIELRAQGRTLRVTPEHPVAIAPGVFRMASRLRAGDTVRVYGDCPAVWDCPLFPFEQHDGTLPNGGSVPTGAVRDVALSGVTVVKASHPAYNLLVSPGGTFVAGDFVLHNKGCFLPDTPILRADGSSVRIRDVRPGDELLAFTPDEQVTRAAVRSIVTREVDGYAVVEVEGVALSVTPEHPFYVGEGTFRTIESLRPGDKVFVLDGSGLAKREVVSIARVRGRVTVYNLQTDDPHTYFAAGVAVHNKGGGGGCFPAGTLVSTLAGDRAIELLCPGDRVLALDAPGRIVETSVERVSETRSEIFVVETASRTLRTTAEHPLRLADGSFRLAGEIRIGDRIVVLRDGRAASESVTVARSTGEVAAVHNLSVGAPHTFFAGGVAVHNKGGGCFPAGTRIRTPGGDEAIEALAPGDVVLSVDANGHAVYTTIESVMVRHDGVFIVETDVGVLRTTREHPVRMGDGSFRSAAGLQPGDRITTLEADRLALATVVATRESGVEDVVYNLAVEAPHTFVADGFVVHNKGGGFGGGHGGSGDVDVVGLYIVLGAVGVAILWYIISNVRSKSSRDENLDYLFSRSAVGKKSAKTDKLLEFIAKTDSMFQRDALDATATATFTKLQECWQARDYGPMQPLMMPDLYAEHCAQLEGMKRDHEIDRIEGLSVWSVDIVNVRYTNKPDDREFTALITAKAKDYYVDDRDQHFLRGDSAPAKFQEFWTFHLVEGKWLLREIQQTGESDILKEENFFEPMTEQGLADIYGDKAKESGEKGPWLEKGTEVKAARIERMLNFLVQTDKLWDRQAMIETARKTFLGVFLSRESGDETKVPRDLLFPNLADALATEIAYQAQMGSRIEFRNLCVRKVELILVRNYEDNAKDEFTVRITAHAQVVFSRGGTVLAEQDYVTAFEEYWTFGRLDNAWKLKEIEPHAEGQGKIEAENLDQDSTPSQLQWYYRQPRAN